MDFRYEDFIKTQLIMAFQGHNKTIIGYLFTFLSLLIVAYHTHIQNFIQQHVFTYSRKQSSIELFGAIYEDKYYTRRVFSKRFISLLHFLNNQHSSKQYPVRKLLEVCIEDMESVNKNNIDDMIINQKEQIELNDSIFCKFDVSCEDSTNDKHHYKYTTVKVYIYSKTKTVKDISLFLEECVKSHDEHLKNLLQKNIYNFIYDQDDEGIPCFKKIIFKSNKTFDNVFFSQKEELVKRLDFFNKGEELYKKLGIPHTFGVLMHGEPGTGKTSTIKAIVNYTKRHIISIPLHKIKDMSVLTKLFLSEIIDGVIVPFDKRVYVFEELDCNGLSDVLQERKTKDSVSKQNHNDTIIDKLREQIVNADKDISIDDISTLMSPSNLQNDKNKKTITLGSLLELLDGVVETPGRIIIMTTNYPDRLDKALVRPGRIDMNIQFSNTTKQDLCDIFNLWFNRKLTSEEMFTINPERFSHAEICKIFFNNLNKSDDVIKYLQHHTLSYNK
jgi:ATP-dependent 26S proteasome regulatory subunit